MFDLRYYQQEAINAALEHKAAGGKSGLQYLATGAGKTVIAQGAVAKISGKALMLVHRDELAKQSVSKMKLGCPDRTVGTIKAEQNELGCDITVASIQTVMSDKRLTQLLAHGPYELVIADEAHHSAANGWQKVLKAVADQGSYIMGLTATPKRADGKPLAHFEKILYSYPILKALADQYLCDIEGLKFDLDLNLDEVSKSGSDFNEGNLSQLMREESIIDQTVDIWFKYGRGKPTITFAVDVAHTEQLEKAFRDKGVKAHAIIGTTPVETRTKLFQDFDAGKIDMLISCMVLTEGFDSAIAQCCLLARPTLSESLYIQMVGRVLRLHPGKDKATLIDVSGNSDKHQIMQLGILFGYDNMKSSVENVMEEVEDAQGTGALRVQKLDSVRSLLKVPKKVNLTDAKKKKQLRWVETDHGLGICLCKGQIFVIEQDKEKYNSYSLVHYYTDDSGWQEKSSVAISDLPFDWCLALAEKHVMEKNPVFASAKAPWLKEPVSEGQLNYIKNLGIKEIPKTKGEASDILGAYTVTEKINGLEPAMGNNELINRLSRVLSHNDLLFDISSRPQESLSIMEVKNILSLNYTMNKESKEEVKKAAKRRKEGIKSTTTMCLIPIDDFNLGEEYSCAFRADPPTWRVYREEVSNNKGDFTDFTFEKFRKYFAYPEK